MHIVIIGNGIAGITAARFIRKLSQHRITVISAESRHYYSRPALMYLYMGHLKYKDVKPYEDWFWKKNRIELVQDRVIDIDFSARQLTFASHDRMGYDRLLLATGSVSNKFGWNGENLRGVQGLYNLQDLDQMEERSSSIRHAVIVGGGLIGIEMAEMFYSRKIPVTFLVRENSFLDMTLPPEESELVNRTIREHGIDLKLKSELEEIIGKNGDAVAVKTREGEQVSCEFVGLTVGVKPNIDFLKGSDLEIDQGILCDQHLKTNIRDVYAAGDCAQIRNPKPGRKPVEALWYAGRIMGETAAYNICDRPVEYEPGIWFNSAKFFDIEYQVYGDVPVKQTKEIQSVFWQDRKSKRSIRLSYGRQDGYLRGVLSMGIRLRQEVCEKWIRDKVPVEIVLSNLEIANFDPEYSRNFCQKLRDAYTLTSGKHIEKRARRGWSGAFQFLRSGNR